MKYRESIIIALPRFQVLELLDSIDHLPKWQPDLIHVHPVEGPYRQPGSTCELRYKMGNGEMMMTETIVERKLPESITVQYQSKEVWNQLQSQFTETDSGDTLWTLDCEFRCTGFMKLMTWFMPRSFKRETQNTLAAFKQFAESVERQAPNTPEAEE